EEIEITVVDQAGSHHEHNQTNNQLGGNTGPAAHRFGNSGEIEVVITAGGGGGAREKFVDKKKRRKFLEAEARAGDEPGRGGRANLQPETKHRPAPEEHH